MSVITFQAESVVIEPAGYQKFNVRLEADMTEVVEDMTLAERLYDLDPADIVSNVGAVNVLNAVSEVHFDQWIAAGGDYYEALNSIGIEKIREWIDDYTSGE